MKPKNLMLKPRCGNADIISDYKLSSFKWNKATLTSYYYLANPQDLVLTKKAFPLWEEKRYLHFIHDRTNTDILISGREKKHMMVRESELCPKLFDGKSRTLAHAHYPDKINSTRKIYMDEDEPWSYDIENVDVDKVSLFATLVHEIGHALGLRHSDVTDSIMYAFYTGKKELGDDDILGIQNLYGKPQNTKVTPQIQSSTTPSTASTMPLGHLL